ncbi:zona pellucida-like domain-containing protein 1 [Engraulis encrasicolus]|uniref:zona pellucida-like domain-containing protein 1 n=1 Tax=Engraulis encrasicolus TaxID=184585 RepID=UPI002FCFFED0
MIWRLAVVVLSGLVAMVTAQDVITTLERCATDPTYKPPSNSDMTVTCHTERMMLSILLCPMYFSGYNESLMALNARFRSECRGTADLAADPPVLKFTIDLDEASIKQCGCILKTMTEPGTGIFSDYSSVQYVNISGIVNALDPTAGTITYKEEIMYLFSCQYPLQYFVNNTELSVSGVNLAVKDNNGSFISTLSMKLYKDQLYTQDMIMPDNGLQLKTRIFVEIKATNLTSRFNVLLDRCYASVSPAPTNSTYYDLFVGCNRDPQTVVHVNGMTQKAQFSFEAFRFTEHKNRTISTFYLHCLTRLCENATCASMMPVCTNRRRREAEPVLTYRTKRQVEMADSVEVTTVSSGPIVTRADAPPTSAASQGLVGMSNALGSKDKSRDESSALIGVAVAAGILSVVCISMAVAMVWRRTKH